MATQLVGVNRDLPGPNRANSDLLLLLLALLGLPPRLLLVLQLADSIGLEPNKRKMLFFVIFYFNQRHDHLL